MNDEFSILKKKKEQKLIFMVFSLLFLIPAIALTAYWTGLEWWKALILYVLFAMAYGLDQKMKGL